MYYFVYTLKCDKNLLAKLLYVSINIFTSFNFDICLLFIFIYRVRYKNILNIKLYDLHYMTINFISK